MTIASLPEAVATRVRTIALTIDGVRVEVREGTTVLEAARKAGVYIPTLCYDDDLKPYGACRLCVVEIENMRGLPDLLHHPGHRRHGRPHRDAGGRALPTHHHRAHHGQPPR